MEPRKKPWIDIHGLRLPDFLKTILRAGTMHVFDALQLTGHTVNNMADVMCRNWNRIEEFVSEISKNEDERISCEKKRIASEDLRREQEEVREVGEKTRKRNEVWRQENEEKRIEAENVRSANEDVREELRRHPWYIDDDGYLNEYSLEDHAYHRRDDRYMRGGVDYPSMRVLNSMHLYVLPVANGNQFKVEGGHLTFKMKTIAV